MRILLQRPLSLRCYHVAGTMGAREKDRAELLAVIQRCMETGDVDAEDVARHLLAEEGRAGVAQRLIDACCSCGLLEAPRSELSFDADDLYNFLGYEDENPYGHTERASYKVTEEGERALSTGAVFLPQPGIWAVLTSPDSLLPAPLLLIEELSSEPGAWEERFERDRAFERTPQSVLDSTRLTPVIDAGLRIESLGEKCEIVDTEEALRIVWECDDDGTTRLRIDGDRRAELEPPRVGFGDLWQALRPRAWDSDAGALRVAFDELTDAERTGRTRTLEQHDVDLGALGTFATVKVTGVPLRPATTEDADRWLSWTIRSRLRGYARPAEVVALAREANSLFPERTAPPPTAAELAAGWCAESNPPSPAYWHVQAPIDWVLGDER